jgi:hypothetical protein
MSQGCRSRACEARALIGIGIGHAMPMVREPLSWIIHLTADAREQLHAGLVAWARASCGFVDLMSPMRPAR